MEPIDFALVYNIRVCCLYTRVSKGGFDMEKVMDAIRCIGINVTIALAVAIVFACIITASL